MASDNNFGSNSFNNQGNQGSKPIVNTPNTNKRPEPEKLNIQKNDDPFDFGTDYFAKSSIQTDKKKAGPLELSVKKKTDEINSGIDFQQLVTSTKPSNSKTVESNPDPFNFKPAASKPSNKTKNDLNDLLAGLDNSPDIYKPSTQPQSYSGSNSFNPAKPQGKSIQSQLNDVYSTQEKLFVDNLDFLSDNYNKRGSTQAPIPIPKQPSQQPFDDPFNFGGVSSQQSSTTIPKQGGKKKNDLEELLKF